MNQALQVATMPHGGTTLSPVGIGCRLQKDTLHILNFWGRPRFNRRRWNVAFHLQVNSQKRHNSIMVNEAYLGTLRVRARSIVIQCIWIIIFNAGGNRGSGMLLHKCPDEIPTNGVGTLEERPKFSTSQIDP